GKPHVREVAPLYVEALHLLVKEEIADAVARSFGALRGRVVGMAPEGSTSAGLAMAVLEFAGVPVAGAGGAAGSRPRPLGVGARAASAPADDSAFPDTIIHLATVPSKVALQLIHRAGYRLVPVPFAEAFRLNAILSDDAAGNIERRHVSDAVIPAFTYGTEPAI